MTLRLRAIIFPLIRITLSDDTSDCAGRMSLKLYAGTTAPGQCALKPTSKLLDILPQGIDNLNAGNSFCREYYRKDRSYEADGKGYQQR